MPTRPVANQTAYRLSRIVKKPVCSFSPKTDNQSIQTSKDSHAPEYIVVPALPSIHVAELLVVEPIQRPSMGLPIHHGRCLVRVVDSTSWWKPTDDCWIVQEPPSPPHFNIT